MLKSGWPTGVPVEIIADALQISAGTVFSARNGDRNQRRRQASE